MAAVSIRRGYSAAKTIGMYAISSHVFEVFNIGGREIRIDAGKCLGTRSMFVGAISEGVKIFRVVVDPQGEDEKTFVRKLLKLAQEIVK